MNITMDKKNHRQQSMTGNTKKATKYTGERTKSDYRVFSRDYALFFLALHENRVQDAGTLKDLMERANTDGFHIKEISRYNSMMEYVNGAWHQASFLSSSKE